MQLLELTPAEIAFLTVPSALPDALQTRLTRRLATTLTARLRLPVQAIAQPATRMHGDAPATPNWQPDAQLATLWLTRRLGGQHVTGSTSFVPNTLIHTLDAVLAESWLDAPAQTVLPPALTWQLTTDLTLAMLAVQLPHHTTDMTRWARGVIKHG
jgi:hypothetical protein